ncbi:hypothetical protein [Mycolicibacterium neoaurum]|uniref:hypothetical protein n=1 Tax=Mycolicibacterium neoaurum TaxID=1795 RepID=UPI001F4C6C3F|nr:hypothetical protein [Mycolicibacterium neoaurum]
MGKVKAIKNALVETIKDLQYEGAPAFTNVTDDTSSDFDSYPVARVLPAPDLMTNEKGAMSQNDRTVRFNVVVHAPLEDPTKIQSNVIDHMTDLADLLIDTFDIADYTDVLKAHDETLGVYIMSVPTVTLDPVDSKGSALLMLVATVEVEYSKDL